VTVHDPSPLEQVLRGKLDQFVAEAGAAQILPGYEYPELLLWVHDPADQPPDLDAVRVMGEQFRTEQAQQAAAQAQEHYWATRTGSTQAYYLDATADDTAEDTHDAASDAADAGA
jgi:acyl-CoA reductase-like NAD-dependent aldehyde dehydrogenase